MAEPKKALHPAFSDFSLMETHQLESLLSQRFEDLGGDERLRLLEYLLQRLREGCGRGLIRGVLLLAVVEEKGELRRFRVALGDEELLEEAMLD